MQDTVNVSINSKHVRAKRYPISSPDASLQEKELARNARHNFNEGNYSQSLVILKKLENLRSNDAKVSHSKCTYI